MSFWDTINSGKKFTPDAGGSYRDMYGEKSPYANFEQFSNQPGFNEWLADPSAGDMFVGKGNEGAMFGGIPQIVDRNHPEYYKGAENSANGIGGFFNGISNTIGTNNYYNGTSLLKGAIDAAAIYGLGGGDFGAGAGAVGGSEVAALPVSGVGASSGSGVLSPAAAAPGTTAAAAGNAGAAALPSAGTGAGWGAGMIPGGAAGTMTVGAGTGGLTAAELAASGAGAGAASSLPAWAPYAMSGANTALGIWSANKAAGAQADAANNASQNSLQASREANALQEKMFNKQIELQAPFREAGLSGQNRLLDLLGLSKNTAAQGYGSANAKFGDTPFTQDPSYQFRLQQGQKALERSAAARGGLLSGRAMKDMTEYAQGMASQEYGNAYNRFQTDRANQLNPLQSLAGQAQTASNTMGTAANNYGTNVGNNITNTANTVGNNTIGAGNANASGYIGTANAVGGGVNQLYNYYGNQDMLNRLNGRG